MNPRLVRADDFTRLKQLAVHRDCQGFAQVDTWQAGDADLEFQRRGSSDLDFDLCADFTVSGSRRDGFAILFLVPPRGHACTAFSLSQGIARRDSAMPSSEVLRICAVRIGCGLNQGTNVQVKRTGGPARLVSE